MTAAAIGTGAASGRPGTPRRLAVVADDLTGACDVGGELAAAGYVVRVQVDGAAAAGAPDALYVVNTQSRSRAAATAARRVRRAVAAAPADVLLKKIDTALRGHLGAELAAALEGAGAAAAFVLAAIPAAGRVTRGGCQWFGGRPLAATEFARDPEGRAGTSSIPAVLAAECGWPSAVVDVETVRGGALATRARALVRAGTRFVVVDAEREEDIEQAVGQILSLPGPLCLAGSVALARALARRLGPGSVAPGRGPLRVPPPCLVVSGSLHSQARAQVAALVAAGLAETVTVATDDVAAPAGRARALLDTGRSVVVAPPAAAAPPSAAAMRRIEERLAAATAAVVAGGAPAGLILVGGETSHAILRRIGACELVLRGCPSLLLAVAEVAAGPASGAVLATKGGSGGGIEALVELLSDESRGEAP